MLYGKEKSIWNFAMGLTVILILAIGTLIVLFAVNLSQVQQSESQEDGPSEASLAVARPKLNPRAKHIRQLAQGAWQSYVRHAWGDATLGPVSGQSRDYFGLDHGSGLTIVNSLSTLWVMGLRDEFAQARDWVTTKMNLSSLRQTPQVLHVLTHYVGPLLSAYALTNDTVFRDKAEQVATLVQPAFSTVSGIPRKYIHLRTRSTRGTNVWLSQAIGFQAELNYLSEVTGRAGFRDQSYRILDTLRLVLDKPRGPDADGISVDVIASNFHLDLNVTEPPADQMSINFKTPIWTTGWSSFGAKASEFYRSLLNTYLTTPEGMFDDILPLQLLTAALDAADQKGHMFVQSTVLGGGLTYTRDYDRLRLATETNDSNEDSTSDSMGSDACYLGALLARTARLEERNILANETRITRYWDLARRLTETCHRAARATPTRLPPSRFYHNQTHEVVPSEKSYRNSPELAESYLVLYRMTGQEKYREYAWHLASAITSQCVVALNESTAVAAGIADVVDVTQHSPVLHDYQHPLVLSATLKYLYLTFVDEDDTEPTTLPLSKWAFTTTGHPLPITRDRHSVVQRRSWLNSPQITYLK